jgi:hypothetical protein
MHVSDLEKAFDKAPPLLVEDVLLSDVETSLLDKCLLHCILRIVVKHGGAKFAKFQKDLDKSQPGTDDRIDIHKTPLHPLPGMNIDESTIVGNAEVVEAILKELGLLGPNGDLELNYKIIKIFAGDQLSIARLRALANIRAGHEGKFSGFGWGVWMPGLFHAKIADMHGFFVTHWGKPNAGTRNPGCLAFHNTNLNRNPITLTSLPPFRTCWDLVFVSLYARVLHCLLLVSGKKTLDEYADSVDSFEQLHADASDIFKKYTDPEIVADLRWKHRQSQTTSSPTLVSAGDMVFENAILFLRDALLSREFTDAIKAGDSEWVVLILKVWALSFRGSGRTKYAYEMLQLIHNLTNVWPKPIWYVMLECPDEFVTDSLYSKLILNNWLLNPTGRPNSWVEVDLMQEHMNYWIKVN